MGNRVSIRFINRDNNKAPVIFSHWGGMEFVKAAQTYAYDLKIEREGSLLPLDRLEPQTVTCDFLFNLDEYWPVGGSRISSDIYIGIDEDDGDNGDNGHFNIDLTR